MIRRLLDWLDQRTGFGPILHEALYERVPGGARWRYVWGSTLVFTFVTQVITGLFLWTAYSSSAQTAWESVYYIEQEMTLGSVVRGIHHFTASAMVVLLGIHMVQVIIDGAYRAPREINFWVGLVLLQIVLGLALTGYLLPWDQKGYYATQVSTKIMGATPVVGVELQELAQGGKEYGHHTLTRFFAMHAGVFPAMFVGCLAFHIYVFRRHGLTVKLPKRKPDTTFWPDQVLKDGIGCLAVLVLVLVLTLWKGAELNAPADPSVPFKAARPEWYFLFLFRFLKFEFIERFGLAFGAIYVPGLVMLVIALMPLVGRSVAGHKFNVAFTWALTAGISLLTVMAFVEDGSDDEHQAALREAHRDAVRIRELAAGPDRIPVSGAVTLMREDPFTQGPRLFAKHCSACHRYNRHNGRGRLVYGTARATDGKPVEAPPTAPDLGRSGLRFASREWMSGVVLDYRSHFAALKDAPWFDESEMANWSDNAEALRGDANRQNVADLVEFLVSQAGHRSETVDKVNVDRGRALAVDGGWAGGIEITCADCHSTIGEKDFMPISEDDADGYPNLSGYGSAAWLKSFISNPGAAQHYGEKNQMPAFEKKMTSQQLDLLVRWLARDYVPTEIPPLEPPKPADEPASE